MGTDGSGVDVRDIPPIRGGDVWRIAETEHGRWAKAVAGLGSGDWGKPTDCGAWDVRDLCLHLLGAMEAQASPRELIHQFRRGIPLNKEIDSHHWVDGVNELQVRERRHLGEREIVERTEVIAPKAVQGRRRTPPPVRWMPVPFGPPIGWKPLTYLLRMGFTRDVWMHRIDLARAIGGELEVTPEHDGRIVAGIVAEWARIHREPFTLTLEGPAGGVYRQGSGGEEVTIDAIELCRVLAGRGTGTGVLAHPLPL